MSALTDRRSYSALVSMNTEDSRRTILALPELLHEHGLNLDVHSGGVTVVNSETIWQDVVQRMEGIDTSQTLQDMSNSIDNLRVLADLINVNVFRSIIEEKLPATRPAQAALERLQATTSGRNLCSYFDIIIKFYQKDIKHPLRNISISAAQLSFQDISTGQAFPHMGTLGEALLPSARPRSGWVTVVEDTPSLRRYVRYLDSLAQEFGFRVLFNPTSFSAHPFEQSSRLVIGSQGINGYVEMQYHGLAIYLFGDYERFYQHGVIETAQQPNQQNPSEESMSYIPLFNNVLPSILKVMETLGAFSPCKIYYKDYKRQQNSPQVVPSSSQSSTIDSSDIPF